MENKICHVCKKEKKPYLKIMDSNIFSFIKHEQAREEGEICERCDNYFGMTGEFKDATEKEFEVARKSVHFASAMLRWWQKDKKLDLGDPEDYYSIGDSDENNRDWGGTHDIAKWYRDEYSEEEKDAEENKQVNSHQEDSKKPMNKVATPKSEIGLDISDDLNSNEEVKISLTGEPRKGKSELAIVVSDYVKSKVGEE